MARPSTGWAAGKQLCESLGLDPNLVSRLVITVDVQEAPTVEVTTYPLGTWEPLVTGYTLTPIPVDDEPAD